MLMRSLRKAGGCWAWWVLGLAAVMALALAGCGEDEAQTGQGMAELSPCTLVNAAEAAQVLGMAVKDGALSQSTTPLGQKSCLYRGMSNEGLRFVQVTLVTDQGMGESLRQGGYDSARLFAQSRGLVASAKEVPGLGQEAFWAGGGADSGAGLHVLTPGAYLNVAVSLGDPKRELAAAQALAELALERMPPPPEG